MPLASRLLTDITPLRESPHFRTLWVGTTLSAVGGALTMFALPLQIYDITRSPFAVGALGMVRLVPTLSVGLLGGALTDAMDRRKLALLATFGHATLAAALTAQAFAGLSILWLLCRRP